MKTPIADFVARYAAGDTARLHMPGHKGCGPLGVERLDITEVEGADVLSHADGIIAESEKNATALFGTGHTFYTTEGSTSAIQAMLALVSRGVRGRRPRILAARNVHKAFVYGCALLDIEVEWLYPRAFTHLTVCEITANEVERALKAHCPDAVYLTSPDYVGNVADIAGISTVCRRFGVPLLVDNAHGAYLRFLPEDRHPMTLGATLCCDSAHKTLPVLTGGAYLHVAKDAPAAFLDGGREALALFCSTSPSYLILQSLDLCNRVLAENYRENLQKTIESARTVRKKLLEKGFLLCGDEPLKLTLLTAASGLSGEEAAAVLRRSGVECEFADRDLLVLMLSPCNTEADLQRLLRAVDMLPVGARVAVTPPPPAVPERVLSLREAVLAPAEYVPVEAAMGRICASPTVACPPAVPVLMSGERVDARTAMLLQYYGMTHISVVRG
ncbi:MAG: amino acid decarboxylase [Ruminococcaceae bacterium]|nr:amino acid decarboxylase [Oscillospiraceae bacterium]